MNPVPKDTQTPCAKAPEVWFPKNITGANAVAKYRIPQNICRSACPIRQQCLDLAMKVEGDAGPDARHGVYGGLTPKQRHRLRAAQREAAQQALAA
jgi:WhiB family redox-sensing transcriptional regulator